MDPRSRRTGEHNAQVIKLMADAVVMREQIDALEGRLLRLESELAAMRASIAKLTAPVAVSIAPRASKRPAPLGPPPLPPGTAARPSMQPRRPGAGGASGPASGGRRSIVDISETAELLESIPPPPRAPRK